MVIAKKSISVGFLYTFCLILSIVISCLGIYGSLLIIIGVLLAIASLFILVDYFSIPRIPILLEGNNIILQKKMILSLNDILDVSYQKAFCHAFHYRFGTITIVSTIGTFECRYISDCENVANKLFGIVKKENAKSLDIASN